MSCTPAPAMGTMLGWFQEGGPIMLVIALVGLVGIAVLVERLYVIVFRSQEQRSRLHRADHSTGARRQDRRSDQAVRELRAALSRHGPAHSAQPESRRGRSAERRHGGVAVGRAQADAAAPVSADARRGRDSARRARLGARLPRRAAPAGSVPTTHALVSAGFAAALTPTTFGARRWRRADTWPRLSRESGRGDHRTDSRSSRRG